MSTPRSSRPNRFQPYVPYRRQAALVEAQRAVEETEARAALAEAQQALEEAEARRSEIRFRSLVRRRVQLHRLRRSRLVLHHGPCVIPIGQDIDRLVQQGSMRPFTSHQAAFWLFAATSYTLAWTRFHVFTCIFLLLR